MVKSRRLRKSTIEVQPQSNVDVQCEHQIPSEDHVEHNNNQLPTQSDSDAQSLPATDSLVDVPSTDSNGIINFIRLEFYGCINAFNSCDIFTIQSLLMHFILF
ncbi:hypothetical protein HS088_TW07G01086 [Tripterygium wilfordii]|uniref:Uncharacterized protein n=1 Tax=Tripterygium wilfordii TaxID=458696 RepID=A0A7J7DGV3_TRIWF|nr:hypothetical protein HS088_TW07G01086 [Tripterygium wilfordii]